MTYRVLALTIAAAVSLASATLAKEHCPVGQVYFRSKHTCVGKRTAIARKIYHYPRHVAAQADEAAIVHHRLRRACAATTAAMVAAPQPPANFATSKPTWKAIPHRFIHWWLRYWKQQGMEFTA